MTTPSDNAPSDNEMELLTAYALQALEPEQTIQVIQLLEQQPELLHTLAELRAIADALPYALTEAVPPPDLKQRTLAYAVGRGETAASEPPAARTNAPWLRRWVYALATVAVVALVAVGVLWQQLAAAQTEMAILRQQQEQFAAVQQQIAATVAQPANLVQLVGANGHGTVMRNADGTAIIAAHLPQLQSDRVYQFWLINGSAAPVSGGTFLVDAQGNGILTLAAGANVLSADTFAVTDEPHGGSPGPTNQPLISGRVASA